jgi:hypothetical protein
VSVTVEITPGEHPDCTHEKSAVFFRILRGRQVLWAPPDPICLSPLYHPDTAEARGEAATVAVEFFGWNLSGDGPLEGASPPEIEVGTVIEGTHRPEDLIPALLEELGRIDPRAASELRLESASFLDLVEGEAAAAEKRGAWLSDEAAELLESLFDALEERAPEGLYFGAHWGDGADLGWWPHEGE